jgi:hypothetical protein
VKLFDREKFIETASSALGRGGRSAADRFTTVEWDISGRCQSPVHREVKARSRPGGMELWNEVVRWATDLFMMELETRCRKCPPCLRARAAYWRLRSESEIGGTLGRTWFVTLTLRPEEHFKATLQASLRLQAGGVDFDRLEPSRQFAERDREIQRDVTLYLKRVRKESGAPLRYILVSEAHKSGLPHYHALIHEVDPFRPVSSRTLASQWRLGFSQSRLVAQDAERRSAAYVAKYLSKSAISRVRASQGYGHGLKNSQINLPRCLEKKHRDPHDLPSCPPKNMMEGSVAMVTAP